MTLLLAAAAAALLWLRLAWLAWRSSRALEPLASVPPDPAPPSVSVVVPCRNEARDVERCVRSLLAQDLPALEVIAVDDRSEDATGAILDRLAAGEARLRVLHVTALPAGWLGKNHALELGGRLATGEWLLFTDGDLVFAPDALRRALALARARGLGHLAGIPRFVAPGLLERAFVAAFGLFGALAFRVQQLPRPGTPAFVGVGAFNLVRRDAWEGIGGHRRLALEVVDDVKLGLVLRRSGVPQGAARLGELGRVRWQHGFRATVRGLVKNAFAGTGYRPAVAAAAALLVGAAGAGPALLVAVALAGAVSRPSAAAGAAVILAALAWLLSTAAHGASSRRLAGGHGPEGLLFPLVSLALAGVLLASVAAALRHGGVRWRGTHYPLAELQRGCVREEDWPVERAAGWPG